MSGQKNADLKELMARFAVLGDYAGGHPYGSGHINDTYQVTMLQAGRPVRYILQRLNGTVFPEPLKLMDNVSRICRELQSRLAAADVEDASRRALTTVAARDGEPCIQDEEGSVWRLYLFIEDAIGYDIVENISQAFEAARAFGAFQKLLTDLPGDRLNETIPGFHDTPARFAKFKALVDADPLGLAGNAGAEIEAFLSYESEVSRLVDLNREGKLPERVTHNDTKLNNVLIDCKSDKAMCVIDLDTSMPGLAPYDFGDLVRTSTVSAPEDEADLSLISVRSDMYEALVKGYLSEAGEFLTPCEAENLFFGGKLMSYEVGLRFLTDYLEGNVYFKTKYKEHNLVRCRTQMAIVKDLEKKQSAFEDLIRKEYENTAQS